MLRELDLTSLGVIEHASLTFAPGLTAITGETGAGKTMLLGALAWLAGARADSSLVGGERAQVSGVFVTPDGHPAACAAADAGAALEAGELIAARVVTAQGRSRAHLGGVAVPSSVLAASVGRLVAVHGQSDQLRLRSAAEQRDLLDAFGGVDTSRFQRLHSAVQAAQARLAQLDSQNREAAWEADALRRAVREIDAVAPEAGEEEELPTRIERLAHAEELREAAATGWAALMGADDVAAAAGHGGGPRGGAGSGAPPEFSAWGAGATAALDGARRALEAGAGRDPALAALAARAGDLAYLASDLGAEVGEYAATLESDPAQLAALQERRAALGQLLRKYGATAADVLEWAEGARQRLADLDSSPERRERLAAEAAALTAERDEAAAELTRNRRAHARELSKAVTVELAGLGMTAARFAVAVEAAPVGPSGADAVEFQFAAHGDQTRPLAKGASGGELSRVMLALEVAALSRATAGADALTLVFDEVDQGVGGAAALALAERLARLGRGHQVFAVTHLPQIAAAADHHVLVVKRGGVTEVRSIVGDERRREVARMLAGVEDSAAALRHADELLSRAWAKPR
ncbi:MAG: DNA repair protein RecN [Bifidobacteriaceae bacterium]|jgi:DNA repair protein RecN (Recombination protein N)|nr:DNA repair protein RecN [Bifidobacteriaceae bacterium]